MHLAITRREAIAALLPAAQVYLQQLPLSKSGSAILAEQPSASAHDAVATALRDPLVAYLSRKGEACLCVMSLRHCRFDWASEDGDGPIRGCHCMSVVCRLMMRDPD